MNRLSRQFLPIIFFACNFATAHTKNTAKKPMQPKQDSTTISYPAPLPNWSLEKKHHGVHVTPKAQSSHYLKINNRRYNLLNLHFHYPSEHTVNGKFFPLEAHFVHENAQRALAVVCVLIQEGKKPNSWYERLVSCLQKIVPLKTTKTNFTQSLNLEKLLPLGVKLAFIDKGKSPMKYGGITWLIAKQPVVLNKKQIHTIKTCYQNQAHMPSIKKH